MEISTLTGQELQKALPQLAALRMEVFRGYPYLYDGSLDYEESYLTALIKSKDSIIVAAGDGGKIVGCATGSALEGHHREFAAPFLEHGFDPNEVFYCGESVLLPSYRGRGLGHTFFDRREAHAKERDYKYSAFCGVVRAGRSPAQTRNLFPARYVLEEARVPESRRDGRHIPLERHRSTAGDRSSDAILDQRTLMSARVIRVAAAQYNFDEITNFAAFEDKLSQWVQQAVAHGAQLLVFPEYAAMELARIAGRQISLDLHASIEALQYHIGHYEAAYLELAKRYGVFILGGSAPTRLTDGRFVNRAQFFSPNGHSGFQQKHIMTRFEGEEWGISPSAGLCIFDIGRSENRHRNLLRFRVSPDRARPRRGRRRNSDRAVLHRKFGGILSGQTCLCRQGA